MVQEQSGGYGGGQNAGFRDLPEELLEELDLTEIYKNLEKTYPSVKSDEREAMDYVEFGPTVNIHFISAPMQDVFEFLVAVLTKQIKGCDKVELDDEEFVIKSTKMTENGDELEYTINLYQKGEDTVAIEFKKTKGDLMIFYEHVKQMKQFFLKILANKYYTEK